MTQRMVITGASGFIGRQLVPRLKARGVDLVLVGRDTDKLEAMFPGTPACNYSQIEEKAVGFDTLVHLAVMNNGQSANANEFYAVNVSLLLDVTKKAKTTGIETFVNVTTFHALDGGLSLYAKSKARAIEVLDEIDGLKVVNLFLPAVYGDNYAGRLSILRRLSSPLRDPLLTILAAMLPTLHIDQLESFLVEETSNIKEPVLLANPQDHNPVYRFGKRVIDLLFAAAVIGLFWWLLATIWIAVRLTSPGPGIFRQVRVGQHEKTFNCYKFRTMKQGTIQLGTHEVSASAITTIGVFLRKTKLDELPQVWNIISGAMSLIGPRPCLPVQAELISERRKRGIFHVRPGITGLAQKAGIDMSDPPRLARIDAEYIAKRGLLVEILIFIQTIVNIGKRPSVPAREQQQMRDRDSSDAV